MQGRAIDAESTVPSDNQESCGARRWVSYPLLGQRGRLGNQLFQIAATIGIARSAGASFGFPKWQYECFMQNPLPRREGAGTGVSEAAFHYVPVELPAGDVDLVGYFQSEKYFAHIRAELLGYLQLKRECLEYVNVKYSALLNLSNTCSIHVRRKDYLNLPEHHPVLSLDYYQEAMRRFDKHSFLIFSDDIAWCRMNFPGECHFIEGELDIIDLFLMSRCRSHIIANSSFSWWGAWLNPLASKKVIAPKAWFGSAYRDLNTSDLLPPSWLTI